MLLWCYPLQFLGNLMILSCHRGGFIQLSLLKHGMLLLRWTTCIPLNVLLFLWSSRLGIGWNPSLLRRVFLLLWLFAVIVSQSATWITRSLKIFDVIAQMFSCSFSCKHMRFSEACSLNYDVTDLGVFFVWWRSSNKIWRCCDLSFSFKIASVQSIIASCRIIRSGFMMSSILWNTSVAELHLILLDQ